MVRDLAKIKAKRALDLGCGTMRNREFINTDTYIGVELDGERLAKGMENNPDAIGLHGNVVDFEYENGADIIICIQVLLNRYFDSKNTMNAVKNLVRLNRQNGHLIFTIGPKNLPYEAEIDAYLHRRYEHVKKIPFGKLAIMTRLSLPLGYMGSFFKSFWESKDPEKRCVYYYCSGRLNNKA